MNYYVLELLRCRVVFVHLAIRWIWFSSFFWIILNSELSFNLFECCCCYCRLTKSTTFRWAVKFFFPFALSLEINNGNPMEHRFNVFTYLLIVGRLNYPHSVWNHVRSFWLPSYLFLSLRWLSKNRLNTLMHLLDLLLCTICQVDVFLILGCQLLTNYYFRYFLFSKELIKNRNQWYSFFFCQDANSLFLSLFLQ